MNAQQLLDALKKVQEPKGCYFNADQAMTLALLESLLANKQRLGYMACPCRLANGEFEADRDIVCPCEYRAADMAEYGACFCGLYVTQDWNEGKREKVYVPERRPVERILG